MSTPASKSSSGVIGIARRAPSPRANSAAMPWLSDQMCSAIIKDGGRRSFGSVAATASQASRNTVKARSPASRSSGYSLTARPELEHCREQRRLLLGKAQIGAPHALEGCARGGLATVPRAGERGCESLEATPRDIGHERVAVAEMAVGRGGAHPRSPRGVREGEAGGTLLRDEVERGGD